MLQYTMCHLYGHCSAVPWSMGGRINKNSGMEPIENFVRSYVKDTRTVY